MMLGHLMHCGQTISVPVLKIKSSKRASRALTELAVTGKTGEMKQTFSISGETADSETECSGATAAKERASTPLEVGMSPQLPGTGGNSALRSAPETGKQRNTPRETPH